MSNSGPYSNNPATNSAQGMQHAFNAASGVGTVADGMTNYGGAAQAQLTGPQSMNSYMDQYQNPWQQQVMDFAQNEGQRTLDMAQMQNMANADAAGAFGGSRHGLVEAETNARAVDTMNQLAAQRKGLVL